jgi:hypothetical protein
VSKLFLDDRKNPVPSGRKLYGEATRLVLDASTSQDFTPSLDRPTLFEVRTTADIRICARPASYTFVKDDEPDMWGYEIDYFELGPLGSHPCQIITCVGTTAAATVTIVPLASE